MFREEFTKDLILCRAGSLLLPVRAASTSMALSWRRAALQWLGVVSSDNGVPASFQTRLAGRALTRSPHLPSGRAQCRRGP